MTPEHSTPWLTEDQLVATFENYRAAIGKMPVRINVRELEQRVREFESLMEAAQGSTGDSGANPAGAAGSAFPCCG